MRFVALAPYLALPLALACAPRIVTTPAPPPVPGAEIRYSTRPDTTHFVRARLVSIDADSLVVERIVMDPAGRWGDRAVGSLTTDSIASLQVRVRRGGNAGRGALIGAVVGLAAGIGCANDDSWVSPDPGACIVSGVLGGAGTGALIGLLVRSDVWAPAPIPRRPPDLPEAPPVTVR